MALNPIDQTNRITDIYILKDWRIIDDVQEKVALYLDKFTFLLKLDFATCFYHDNKDISTYLDRMCEPVERQIDTKIPISFDMMSYITIAKNAASRLKAKGPAHKMSWMNR